MSAAPALDPAVARKQLAIRSWRRGMREVDLLLGPYADESLAQMDDAALAAYAALLDEEDQPLYAWILAASQGRSEAPPRHQPLIDAIAALARRKLSQI